MDDTHDEDTTFVSHKIDTVTREAQDAVDDAAKDMRVATDKLIAAMQKEKADHTRNDTTSSAT